KRWHSRVESARAETSTHRQRVPTRVSRGRRYRAAMPSAPSVLPAPTDALAGGSVQVVDLTAPLSADTPVIQLPPEFGQTARFELEEISRYDERGPAWYWNNFRSGEHTGTHFDAPNHWVTGQGGIDVASVPVGHLIRPAVVLDFSAQVAANVPPGRAARCVDLHRTGRGDARLPPRDRRHPHRGAGARATARRGLAAL